MSQEYWENKLRYYLHDPVDKALSILGHEDRAHSIADAFGVSTPTHDELGKADIAASGLDRAALPGYNADPSKNGAVNFVDLPCLTHPLSAIEGLSLQVQAKTAKDTTEEIVQVINEDIKDKTWSKKQYFDYLFFFLRKQLTTNNVGGFGHLWSVLPADTRIPDHSIWNHNGMVSALASCYKATDSKGLGIGVFSISPVQSFIEKTRKLSDHHTASVILSWLCAEGILKVCESLGPDHILYPSLQGQPLIEDRIAKDLGLEDVLSKFEKHCDIKADRTVASLPNKFVFLLPLGNEAKIFEAIEEHIQNQWMTLSGAVIDYLESKGAKAGFFERIFKRQTSTFWSYQWATNKVIAISDREKFETLMGQNRFKEIFDTVKRFVGQFAHADLVYSPSHSLVQASLAAGKSKPISKRLAEPGEKCPICGEFEVVHNLADAQNKPASEYADAISTFFKSIQIAGALKEKEKLCSICLIKRFAQKAAMTSNGDLEALKKSLGKKSFPSTTEMATIELFDRCEEKGISFSDDKKEELCEDIHNSDEIKLGKEIEVDESDKYYAVLAMDGDKMGDLINGKTVNSTWGTVIHPDLRKRVESGTIKDPAIKPIINHQRPLSPALHSTISEALGNFSIVAVSEIIKRNRGRLIYAGGDDVLAVLPLSTAIQAAKEIQETYNLNFATKKQGEKKFSEIKKGDSHSPIYRFLGNGKGVSISGAILICHHKSPLQGVLEEVKEMLKTEAKDKNDRNSLVVRLRKRSGQGRDFLCKWNDPCIIDKHQNKIESFSSLVDFCNQKKISGSLIYRLAELETSVLSCLNLSQDLNESVRKQVLALYQYEIKHSKDSNARDEDIPSIAQVLAELTIRKKKKENGTFEYEYIPEVPIIARYLSRGGMNI